MKLFKLFENFKNDESGAVTVDWVVLTAAIVGLGIAVLTAVSSSIGDVTDSIVADLATASDIAGDISGGAGGSTPTP